MLLIPSAPIEAGPSEPPNALELSCPAEAGNSPPILAHASGPGALPYAPARRVSFSELLGGPPRLMADGGCARGGHGAHVTTPRSLTVHWLLFG